MLSVWDCHEPFWLVETYTVEKVIGIVYKAGKQTYAWLCVPLTATIADLQKK